MKAQLIYFGKVLQILYFFIFPVKTQDLPIASYPYLPVKPFFNPCVFNNIRTKFTHINGGKN